MWRAPTETGTRRSRAKYWAPKAITLLIMVQDGKEVRVQINETTQTAKNIELGARIKVKVNDQNHGLSIVSDAEVTDRRNVKSRSKTARVGGIGGMRCGMSRWNSYGQKRERNGKPCGRSAADAALGVAEIHSVV